MQIIWSIICCKDIDLIFFFVILKTMDLHSTQLMVIKALKKLNRSVSLPSDFVVSSLMWELFTFHQITPAYCIIVQKEVCTHSWKSG